MNTSAASNGRVREEFAIEQYASFSALAGSAKEWDQFMESLDAEIFLTYDWCRVWWRHYGGNRDLRIFIVRQSGRIVAILPFYKDSFGRRPFGVTTVKMVGVEYLLGSTILPIERSAVAECMSAVLAELQEIWPWDVLLLAPLSSMPTGAISLLRSMQSSLPRGHGIRWWRSDIQTFFKIGRSWEDQLNGLSHHERKRIRRMHRELAERGVVPQTGIAQREQFDQWFSEFVHMHQSQWESRGEAGHFVAWPGVEAFHREAASAQLAIGRLCLMRIVADGECVGYKYGYVFGKKLYALLGARGNADLGKHVPFHMLTFCEQVRESARRGLEWIDSQRGLYEHKLALGGVLKPIINATIVRQDGPFRWIKVRLFKIVAVYVDVVYRKILRRRLLPRLGMRPKQFWQLWIRFSPFIMRG